MGEWGITRSAKDIYPSSMDFDEISLDLDNLEESLIIVLLLNVHCLEGK